MRRPDILFPLFAPATSLSGVGPKLAALLAKAIGVERDQDTRVRDVLFQPPVGVIDRSARVAVADAPHDQIATFDVTVEAHMPPDNPRRPYRVRCSDASGFLTLAWFHARPDYLKRLAPVGARRIVSGKAERFGAEIQVLHPDHVVDPAGADAIPDFEAVYPLTAGLTLKVMRKAAAGAVDATPELPEWITRDLLLREDWPNWRAAIAAVHSPRAPDDLKPDAPARQRLAYDELLADQLTLTLLRARGARLSPRPLAADGRFAAAIVKAAPFAPTGAQMRAADEIAQDLTAQRPMARLLQGDVGAGKTFVAALAAAHVAEAGAQTAIMAPTEILARQHVKNLSPLFEAVGVPCVALTGRDKGAARKQLVAEIAQGRAGVVCGTHALFQEGVDFANLGLVIIDEQHRFGVSDRLKLTEKGEATNLLVMTATPIPRTLTLAAYGDLDVSRLDEKPPGRQPIDTRAVPVDRLDDVLAGVGRALERGDRVYWVCPLVEDTDTSDLASAEERWRTLVGLYGEDAVGLLHGRLPAAEKEARAQAFRDGAVKVLVATTVIEVGVDAPDATVMIIEHAERFGLAQLHQLRGRVGRGSKKSSCLLLYRAPLTDTARLRLDAMRRTEDGFVLAEEDWKLRGPGEVLGLRQSGEAQYRLADIERHGDLLDVAHDDARAIVASDPDLASERGRALRVLLHLFDRGSAAPRLRAG